MFSLRQDALLYSLRPAAQVRLVPAMDDRRAWTAFDPDALGSLIARAERALRAPLPHLTAGDFLRRPDAAPPPGYLMRREQAASLILGACASGDEKFLPRAADLIWMMAEETSWATFARRGAPLPAFGSPDIDLSSALTAELFALARAMAGDRFDRMTPQLNARIEYELRRRVFDPIITRDGEDWMHLSGDAPRIAAHLMAACLSAETDEREQRWQVLRKLLRILENFLRAQPSDGGATAGLSRHVDAACALNDCFSMLAQASGGEVELRDEPQFVDMAILPCKLHIGDGWFVNPGGDPRPHLSPEALFRLGEGVRSGCLCGLAASLRRERPEREPAGDGLFTQLNHLRARASLLREPARAPLPNSILLPETGVVTARAGGFFAALSGGDGRGAFSHRDVGDISLYYEGRPVLIDCGLPGADAHSVPSIEGVEQTGARRAPEPPELRYDGYWLLTMDIAHAYPPAARLSAWQRSLILSPADNAVRLIDTFDFEGAARRATLRFITPFEPILADGGALLGPLKMRFPEGLTPSAEPIPLEDAHLAVLWGEKVYRLSLTTSRPAVKGHLDFTLTPAGG